MQIWAESGKPALPICNYSQILYQFLTFTQNLKRSLLHCYWENTPQKDIPSKTLITPQIGRKDNIHNHFPHQRFLFPFP